MKVYILFQGPFYDYNPDFIGVFLDEATAIQAALEHQKKTHGWHPVEYKKNTWNNIIDELLLEIFEQEIQGTLPPTPPQPERIPAHLDIL